MRAQLFVAYNWGLGTLIDQIKVLTAFYLMLFLLYMDKFSLILSFCGILILLTTVGDTVET